MRGRDGRQELQPKLRAASLGERRLQGPARTRPHDPAGSLGRALQSPRRDRRPGAENAPVDPVVTSLTARIFAGHHRA
jgi:hypothetical protein